MASHVAVRDQGAVMRRALTAEAMRAAESRAVASGRFTLGALMERAGAALAHEADLLVPEGPVAVVCGPGNNGGDGWVAATVLARQGREVRVIAFRSPSHAAAEAAVAASAALEAGVRWVLASDSEQLATVLGGAAVVIDAIFGAGFHGSPREPFASAISAIASAGVPVVSADVPSGLDADSGVAEGAVVTADVTVTFGSTKVGLLLMPGATYAGRVVVADIGMPPDAFEGVGAVEVWDPADYRSVFPLPGARDHKGSRGRIAIVAGSGSYTGAALLAIEGALRMGAGYVIAVVPGSLAELVRLAYPNVIVRAMAAAPDGSFAGAEGIADAVADAGAVVAGPGLTTSAGAAELVRGLVERTSMPLLLDADALNVLVGDLPALRARRDPLLLTPHLGEAARLLGVSAAEVAADRLSAATRLAGPGRTCLVKGHGTVVAAEGRRGLVLAGSPALSRAGTGDVLSGMIGTLLAQGLGTFEAAMLGAHLHGRAAEIGAAELTETCFTATDVPRFLPEAVRELTGG